MRVSTCIRSAAATLRLRKRKFKLTVPKSATAGSALRYSRRPKSNRDTPLQERIDELEMRLAYQEQTIEDLNAALVKQELALQKLERTAAEMLRRLDSLRTAADNGPLPAPRDELPPHY